MNMRPDAILQTLERAGFEARYVGGCVRDTLLGDIRTACPASILRRHPAATLYLDADSPPGCSTAR